MKKNSHSFFYPKFFLDLFFLVLTFLSLQNNSFAYEEKIYKVNLSEINNYDVIEKGTKANFSLIEDVSIGAKKNKIKLLGNNNTEADAFILLSNPGKRFSMNGSIQLSTEEIILDNGENINLSASSPVFIASHPPHANASGSRLARTITTFSISSSPATLGISLGASFLINGFLSSLQNGINDFLWGGLDGAGLSFVEKILRKQPDIYLNKGSTIPFILKDDLKINKGIILEQQEDFCRDVACNVSTNEAINKINNFIEWGDLAGALEVSSKTHQDDLYNDLIKKIR